MVKAVAEMQRIIRCQQQQLDFQQEKLASQEGIQETAERLKRELFSRGSQHSMESNLEIFNKEDINYSNIKEKTGPVLAMVDVDSFQTWKIAMNKTLSFNMNFQIGVTGPIPETHWTRAQTMLLARLIKHGLQGHVSSLGNIYDASFNTVRSREVLTVLIDYFVPKDFNSVLGLSQRVKALSWDRSSPLSWNNLCMELLNSTVLPDDRFTLKEAVVS